MEILAKEEFFRQFRERVANAPPVKERVKGDTEKGKDRMRELFYYILQTQDLASVYDKAQQLMKETTSVCKGKTQQLIQIRGEMAEVLLEMCLIDFISKAENCCYIKNCCVRKRSGETGYTELDVSLFTEHRAYLFEVKSYVGPKKLTEKCLLTNRNGKTDVHSQSVHHMKHIHWYLGDCIIKTGKESPYKICFFDFSNGDLDDQRDERNKRIIPALSFDNIIPYLKKEQELFKGQPAVWDIKNVHKIITAMEYESEENMRKHVGMMIAMRK